MQFLHRRRRVDGQRIGIHLQNLGTVRKFFTAALHVVREHLGKLLCDHIEIALVVDAGMLRAILIRVAKVHQANLVERFQRTGQGLNLVLDSPVRIGEPVSGRRLAGIALHFQFIRRRNAADPDLPCKHIVLIQARHLGRNQVGPQNQCVICPGRDARDLCGIVWNERLPIGGISPDHHTAITLQCHAERVSARHLGHTRQTERHRGLTARAQAPSHHRSIVFHRQAVKRARADRDNARQ